MKRRKKRSRATDPHPPRSILLAEDDLEMRKMLSWSLERKGYKVIECVDGIDLMRKLGLLPPVDHLRPHDLIISDIRMPGRTGLQVLKSAREFPDFPPMILITAFPDAESREQARRLGAAAMMAKPFDIEQLIDKVKEAIPPESERRRDPDGSCEAGQPPFPLEITFRHKSGSQAEKDYIRSVAAKLHPFSGHVMNGRIIVDQSNRLKHKKHRYTVTLMLTTSGRPIVVKYNTDGGTTDDNLYMAINVVFGTASHKLKRHVKKRQEHNKDTIKNIESAETEDSDRMEKLS